MKLSAIYLRGATAHEFQIGRAYFRITHLSGNYWTWKPWRRFRFRWVNY